jgi:hypothetical protein
MEVHHEKQITELSGITCIATTDAEILLTFFANHAMKVWEIKLANTWLCVC